MRDAAAPQTPMPLHTPAGVKVVPSQRAPEHSVLPPGKLQAVRSVPLQLPAQAPVPAQASRPLRGAPVTAVQVPGVALQASHWPLQAWSQHTPSAQKPLAHALLMVHAPPGGSLGVHTPAAQ